MDATPSCSMPLIHTGPLRYCALILCEQLIHLLCSNCSCESPSLSLVLLRHGDDHCTCPHCILFEYLHSREYELLGNVRRVIMMLLRSDQLAWTITSQPQTTAIGQFCLHNVIFFLVTFSLDRYHLLSQRILPLGDTVRCPPCER